MVKTLVKIFNVKEKKMFDVVFDIVFCVLVSALFALGLTAIGIAMFCIFDNLGRKK